MSSDTNPGIFEIGDVLNNTYRIDKVLGLGGTSEVYRAVSEISGRVVAVKALRSEFSRNEDFLALMTREEAMREIRHDAIVRYYDNQRTDDGHVYLVMDYVDGPGLDAKLKSGGMSAEDLLVVCRRVAEGLVAAHKKNIVHRDLSPDNIILRDGDPAEAVIIDFGIAKDTNPGAETIVGNEFAGKYSYAAPEQLEGKTDARADIYALGALLLSTFRGQKPKMGKNVMEVVENKAKALDTSGVPEPLKTLLDRMTHPDRDQRLQTAQAVVDQIATFGANVAGDDEETVVVPRPASRTETAEVSKTVVAPPPPGVEHKPEKSEAPDKKRGALMPILVVLVAAVVAVGVFLSGALDGLLGPTYPVADPYSLVVSRTENAQPVAVGNVPSEPARDALDAVMTQQGGSTDLTLASGDIAQTWGDDILRLITAVSHLPEWRIRAEGNRVQVSGLTYDTAEKETLTAALTQSEMQGALEVRVGIDLGPRVLNAQALDPVLAAHRNCGDLHVIDAPVTGYPNGSQVRVAGRVDSMATRDALDQQLTSAIGERSLVLDVEVLNPTLCLIDTVLPNVPEAGISIDFRNGADNALNSSGDFLVGENPVIDVVIPPELTSGYLFVSALDVSGNVYHLLPNLLFEDNNVIALRGGRDGDVRIRVAYSTAEAGNGEKLAFVVDDTSLGKTKIIVIHSDQQIFDGLRPTTESAGGYADALARRVGVVNSLDSRILTTAARQ